MANRSHFADLLTPGFREIYDNTFKEIPMQMDKLFHVETSSKADEKDSSTSGFGLAVQTAEGAPIDYEDPVQGYDVTYTHVKYSKGFKVTKEMVEDDLYNIIKKKPAMLARSMRRTAENQAAGVFNNAFSTSATGADGKPLASVSHPRPDGGTAQSNASSTGITLSETNLETAKLAVRAQKDDKGLITDIEANTLLVPDALDKTAHLIVDSSMRQGTADNDLNPYKGKYSIVTWKYLTSTTAWFLMDSTTHRLNWFWRRKPTLENDELFDTEVAVYKSTMRFSRGFSDWRGVWGSKGDGAAYSS